MATVNNITLKQAQRRIRQLEARVARLEAQMARERACCRDVVKWIRQEVKWSKEVTGMLHRVNWETLATLLPSGSGDNPPQTPPDCPPAD